MLAAAGVGLLLAGCGGGGGGTPNASASASASLASSANPAAAVTASNIGQTVAGADANAAAPDRFLANSQVVTVEAGPANGVNLLYTSITVCAPGDATRCRTIDHVLVDTGSTGLRLFASAVPAALALPQQNAPGGSALVECMQFADGYSWGPVKTLDLRLAGETIAGLPVQIIGDASHPVVPEECAATGPAENTVRDCGANGVLGIGIFREDCGNGCAQAAVPAAYYRCDADELCAPVITPTALQVKNPVARLARHNNGVLLQLPAVPAGGAAGVTGQLVFGIGTAANNALGDARVFTVNTVDATLWITANGKTYTDSVIDSGSNGFFFPAAGMPVCASGFYCPSARQTMSALVQGKNGSSAAVDINIDNADSLFRRYPEITAMPTLGAPAFDQEAVDLGLPFFFGRRVFSAIEGSSTPGGSGPYVAF